MTRFIGIRHRGASTRTTSEQTAAAFRAIYEARNQKHPRVPGSCCPRYKWGDRTHDLSCPLVARGG